MFRMIVSFIIPVYKVEQYLQQCVNSIASQTYRDIEIILVDDGSPDNSPALCDQFEQRDSRIRVIHKKNGGLSDARNAGLRHATGDYVVFVDGDDFWLEKDALCHLVAIAEKNPCLDFVGFNCCYYYSDTKLYSPWVNYDSQLAAPIDKNSAIMSLVKSGTFPMSACLKLMKRDYLISNNLFFKIGQIAEDIPWFINLLEAAEKFCFVNDYIYAYRQNVVGSITNTSGRKSFDSLFDIFTTELSKIEQRSFSNGAKNAIKSFLAYEYCILLTYKGIDKDTRRLLFSYQNVLNYDLNPKVKRASRWNRLFGIKITAFVLSVYQWKRRNRKYKANG